MVIVVGGVVVNAGGISCVAICTKGQKQKSFTGVIAMSCKHCKPLESTGETEPLIDILGTFVQIRGNKLRLIYDDWCQVEEKTIDFCPVCGESLRPFGQPWGWLGNNK